MEPRAISTNQGVQATVSQLRARLATAIRSRNISVRDIFQTFDKSGDRRLSRPEFREALEFLKLDLTTRDIETLIQEADSRRDGLIDFDEFCKFLAPSGTILSTFKWML